MPSPPEPVSRTHGARARCSWAWCCWFRQYASAGGPLCHRLTTCPAVGAAAPPSLARPSNRRRRCRRRRLAPRLLGWWGWGVCPPRPCPSSLGSLTPAVVSPGFLSPCGNSVTTGLLLPCSNSTPPPTPWQDPRGFLPLWRPRGPPPCPPLWGTRGPLRRPRGPRCRPALPRFRRPYFPTCFLLSPFALASPHGNPALLP